MTTLNVAALSFAAVLLSGCDLSGTWRTVRVEPAEYADTVYSVVTFGEDDRYAGTLQHNGERVTDIGTYDWDGGTLVFTPRDGQPRVYQGRLWLDKTLHLRHTHEGREVTGVMERQED